jgi:hypothetical protein
MDIDLDSRPGTLYLKWWAAWEELTTEEEVFNWLKGNLSDQKDLVPQWEEWMNRAIVMTLKDWKSRWEDQSVRKQMLIRVVMIPTWRSEFQRLKPYLQNRFLSEEDEV